MGAVLAFATCMIGACTTFVWHMIWSMQDKELGYLFVFWCRRGAVDFM